MHYLNEKSLVVITEGTVLRNSLNSLINFLKRDEETLYRGPFLEHNNQTKPYHLILLFIGIVLSAIITLSHFYAFKDHMKQAEQRLQKHQSLLSFTERFSTLDENLTVLAMVTMRSRDRELLGQYLIQKQNLEQLIKEAKISFHDDQNVLQIINELERTNRDLIEIEYKHFSGNRKDFLKSSSYRNAKNRIQKRIRELNKRVVSAYPSAKDSLLTLNKDFERRNAVVIFGLLVFWLTISSWVIWTYDDQKRSRVANSQQRSILEALIQAMPSGVIATDKASEVILWNVSAIRSFPEGPDYFNENVAPKIDQPGAVINFENNVYDRQKRTLIDIDSNEEIGEMILFEDITTKQKIQYELDLERQKKVHLSKMASLGEVAGNLAHEINTPLATLKLSSEGIEKAIGNSDTKMCNEFLKCINQSLVRMSAIVDAFKRYTRIDDMTQVKELSSLNNIVNDVMEICAPDLRSRGIKLEIKTARSDIFLECCAGSISQVIINLITNARDAVKRSYSPWIRIEVDNFNDTAILRVIDSGNGIESKFQDKIFNPFFTTKPRGEGSGIGLGIVKEIVAAHQGNVQYCLKGGHTCFEVTFPSLGLSIAS